MTLSSEPLPSTSNEPTTTLPPYIDMAAVLPELSTPQERYDNGFKRGYMAGYTEGALQAQAERAAELAAHKAAWASTQAHASALLSQLASATEEYLARFGGRDMAMSDQLMAAAFELAEAVIGHELRTGPAHAAEVARSVLESLPVGPACVRVNPGDEKFVRDASASLGRGGQAVEVLPDPEVGPGGCIVTSGAKFVDARVEQALARAREVFLGPVGDLLADEGPDGGATTGREAQL